jgi:hypothetical protein
MQSFRTVYFNREQDAPRIRETRNLPNLKLEYLQEIVKDRVASRIDGVLVDFCTANSVLQVYGCVGKGLQNRLQAMSIDRCIRTCSKLSEK